MSNALFIFCVPLRYIYTNTQRNGLYRAVYPAELQFDVGLQMMKLNADMKCMGLGLYLETILFLRKQQEYKHDFNELDLLADQWGATVENLQHLIKDFDLFLITEDGYFRCLYLDEVMGYQSKLPSNVPLPAVREGEAVRKVR